MVFSHTVSMVLNHDGRDVLLRPSLTWACWWMRSRSLDSVNLSLPIIVGPGDPPSSPSPSVPVITRIGLGSCARFLGDVASAVVSMVDGG
jgi:hypothetical protein